MDLSNDKVQLNFSAPLACGLGMRKFDRGSNVWGSRVPARVFLGKTVAYVLIPPRAQPAQETGPISTAGTMIFYTATGLGAYIPVDFPEPHFGRLSIAYLLDIACECHFLATV